MALKVLMLRKQINDKNKLLDQLRAKDTEFQTREAKLEAAIQEAQTEEEQTTVTEAVEAFEQEKADHETQKANLEREVGELEDNLKELEKEPEVPAVPPAERKDEHRMNLNTRTSFYGMTLQERDAFFADEKVKDFLGEVRTCIKEKRALTNVGLTIPDNMLELMKQRVVETSKLLKYVTVRRVSGTARQNVMGAIPEAVWTEMCAKLNELDLSFNNAEVDGYKVGGFFAVCNAILEDSDIALASELIEALGKAIGKAVDKAIVFGKGTKMPMGFVTRLAQTEQPSDYPATARQWEDLSATHVLTGTGQTGIKLFQEIVKNSSVVDNEYADGGIVWIMNKKTHNALIVQSMDKNLNAAIVAGINNTMPVVGGDIVELPFMPDNVIAFGYPELYLLVERAGTTLSQSEHARFIEDQTLFKGTARYDGKPVIAEAFGIMSITTDAPATSISFPSNTANAS